ncbi:MFS transporter, partial [Photobacterium sanctipauli]
SISASIIYQVPYLKYVFYDQMVAALNVTNTELGKLSGIYGMIAMFCYPIGGILSDKFRIKNLFSMSMVVMGLLTLWMSTLPSYNTLKVIYALMAIFSILTFWASRQKAIRLISHGNSYPKNQGLSSGILGCTSMLFSFFITYVISQSLDYKSGFQVALYYYGAALIVLGALSYIVIPRFDDEISAETKSSNGKLSLSVVKEVLRLPIVWLTTVSVFSVYGLYITVSYTTPYLTNIYGISESTVSIISSIRTYGLMLISAPLLGYLAMKIGSTARMIVYSSIIALVCVACFVLLPKDAGFILPVTIITLIAALFVGGSYGVYFAQFADGKVPVYMFGTATGIVSFVGFMPDVFVHPLIGSWLDSYQGIEGYNYLFGLMAVFATMSLLASFSINYIYGPKKEPKQVVSEAGA